MNTIIIDGNNLLYRSFWTANKNKDESVPGYEYKNVYYFLRCLKSYVDLFTPYDKIYMVWDTKLSSEGNFRKELNPIEYKGGRNNDKFEGIYDNVGRIKLMLNSIGVFNMQPYRMEADDVIAWLTTQINNKKVIISNDKDMIQLIDNHTIVYDAKAKRTFNLETIKKYHDVDTPLDFFNLRLFTGDKSDNISGIYRFGKKSFDKLNENWNGNIETLNLPDDQMEIINRNYKLMNLHYGYNFYEEETISYRAQYFKTMEKKYDWSTFEQLCRSMNFNSILNNIDKWKRTFELKDNYVDLINKLKEMNNAKTA